MGRTRCQPAEPRRAAEDGRHGPAGRTVCRGGGEPASTDPRTRTPGLGARSGRWSGAARPRRAAGPASSPCQAPAQPAEMPIRQVPNSAHVTVPRRRSRTAARPVPRSPPPRPVTLAGTGTEGRCPARHPLPAAGSSPHARSGPRPTTRSTRGRCTARTAGSHATARCSRALLRRRHEQSTGLGAVPPRTAARSARTRTAHRSRTGPRGAGATTAPGHC